MTRLLVAIPCLNEEAHLPGLLAALAADEAARDAVIVVVDGGSTDRSAAIVHEHAARDPRIKLLSNPKRIQSAAINLAVETYGADADYLIRIDAHAGYPHNYLSQLIAACEEWGADSVTVSMHAKAHTDSCFQRANAAAQNSKLGTGGSAHRAGGERKWVDHGHHALFKRAVFVKAGGYDESFTHNEDAELDARIKAIDGKILLAADIVIDYYPRTSARALFKQYLNFGKGRARMLLRHRQMPKPRQAAPLAIAPAVLFALTPALIPVLAPWAAVPALAWLLLCVGYGATLGVKTRDACAAFSGLPAAVMHLAWSSGFWLQIVQIVLAPARQTRARDA